MMKQSIVVAFLCVFVDLSVAQVVSFGGCPKAKPQENFDLNQYLGNWYEIVKFPEIFEGTQSCVRANYSLKDDGHIRVLNTGFKKGQPTSIVGDVYAPNTLEAPAKLKVRFSDNTPYGDYWVLDTDYKTHTLIYSCSNYYLFHVELCWILSRERTLDPAIKDNLYQKLRDLNVNTDKFDTCDQSNCPANQ